MSDRVPPPLPGTLADRVLVAAGATGAVLRPADQVMNDSAGHTGGGGTGPGPSGGHDVERTISGPPRRGAEPAAAGHPRA